MLGREDGVDKWRKGYWLTSSAATFGTSPVHNKKLGRACPGVAEGLTELSKESLRWRSRPLLQDPLRGNEDKGGEPAVAELGRLSNSSKLSEN